MRRVDIDWHALLSAFQMNMPEVRCFLILADGRVLKLPPGDANWALVRADPQGYAEIGTVPSRIQYQWLEEFVQTIPLGASRDAVEAAINGKGAFRRFKDILLTMPEERARWFEFRDDQMRRRVIDWACEQGIEPVEEAPWADELDVQPASLGNAAPAPVARAKVSPLVTPKIPTGPQNNARDIEALRDFLIDWGDGKDPQQALSPLALDELAQEIAKRFTLRAFERPTAAPMVAAY